MFDAIKLMTVIKELQTLPEVTKAEATSKLMLLTDRLDADEEKAIECLAEIAGVACTCDNPELIRRFVKYVVDNGPIV